MRQTSSTGCPCGNGPKPSWPTTRKNQDALSFLTAAQRAGNAAGSRADPPSDEAPSNRLSDQQPTSFANGRYQVKKFLGEGGKKKVYLAQDTLLDREVAFALIKTEGLDEVSRTRITREAQAMGRLGSHPTSSPCSTWVKRRTSPIWSPS